MKRRILTVVLILFVLQAQFAFAAQKEVTKEYTFVTNKDAELTIADIGKGDLSEIPLTIEASGKRYQAAAAEFSLEQEPEKVKETYEDLTAKDVPESIEKDGKVYTLTDVKWTETKRTAATGTKRYYGYPAKPDAPAEKEITATLPDGSRYTPSISSADSVAQSLMQRSSMRFRLLSISPAMNGCAINPIILPTANTMPIS